MIMFMEIHDHNLSSMLMVYTWRTAIMKKGCRCGETRGGAICCLVFNDRQPSFLCVSLRSLRLDLIYGGLTRVSVWAIGELVRDRRTVIMMECESTRYTELCRHHRIIIRRHIGCPVSLWHPNTGASEDISGTTR
jgi:hypothetical protein